MNVVSWSGGTDSTVMLHWLLHNAELEDFKVIFADSTILFPETLTYIDEMVQWLGIQDRFVRLYPKMRFWKKLEQCKFWPSIRALWCREFVKRGPIKAFFRSLNVQTVYDHIGVSYADSPHRARIYSQGGRDYRVRGPSGYTQIIYRYPVIDWTDKQKQDYLTKEKIPRNPIYATVGLSGCYCCPYYHRNEYRRIKKHHPWIIKEICEHERILGKRCSPDFWLSRLDLD